jgi:hypothetical protein
MRYKRLQPAAVVTFLEAWLLSSCPRIDFSRNSLEARQIGTSVRGPCVTTATLDCHVRYKENHKKNVWNPSSPWHAPSVHRLSLAASYLTLVISVQGIDLLRTTCCTSDSYSHSFAFTRSFPSIVPHSLVKVMFTPPPSPQPFRTDGFSSVSMPIPPTELRNSEHTKQRTGRRFLWAVILIPFILITFTLYGGFSTRLVQKLSLASSPLSRHGSISDHSKWKRVPEPQATTSSAPIPTASSAALQPLPTIPSSPPSLLPSFPQAFDSIITQNFSSSSCLNFFNNMTTSVDFRQCRPFSFLYPTSSTFINVSFLPLPKIFPITF